MSQSSIGTRSPARPIRPRAARLSRRGSVLQRTNGATLRRVHQRRGSKRRAGRKRLQADDHEAGGRRRNRDRAILVRRTTHRHLAAPIQCHVHHRCRGLRRYSGIRGVHQSRRKWSVERAVDARRAVSTPAKAVYENKARLYFARLLDSTRVAIEVGRERMGTDKRPGTIELTRAGKQLAFSIKDNDRHAVAKITLVPADDPAAYLPEVAKAAATAGIPFSRASARDRICLPWRRSPRQGAGSGAGQWRTDLVPRFQPAMPDAAVFDSSSEEGAMLSNWGFKPRVLCYLPNVRGVITGVPEKASPATSEGPDQGRRGSCRAASEALVGV